MSKDARRFARPSGQDRSVVLRAVVGVDLAWREHDRLEGDDQVEQTRIAMGSHQQSGATHRVAEPDEAAVGGDGTRGGKRVVAVATPLDLPVVGASGVAVAAVVECKRCELVAQLVGDREVAVAVKAGGVREQERPAGASELVDRNTDVIGRGNAHRAIMATARRRVRIVRSAWARGGDRAGVLR